MANLDIQLQVAIIAAAAALGAAIFAFISAMTSIYVQRKNARFQADISARIKLAEFRQAWINSLREHFVELHTKLAGRPAKADEEISKDLFRILLMLNKDDTNVPKVKKLIGDVIGRGKAANSAQIELLEIFQTIIKDEWEVTKSNLDTKVKE